MDNEKLKDLCNIITASSVLIAVSVVSKRVDTLWRVYSLL